MRMTKKPNILFILSLVSVVAYGLGAIGLSFPFFALASANTWYQSEQFDLANSGYQAVVQENLFATAQAFNNLGNIAYKQTKFDQAKTYYTQALEKESEATPFKGHIHYNLANTYYRLGNNTLTTDPQKTVQQWELAITNYEACLKILPEDEQCKDNLEFVQQKLEELQKQLNNKPEKPPEKPDQQQSSSQPPQPPTQEQIDQVEQQAEDSKEQENELKPQEPTNNTGQPNW
jgi:tetratricopeptide (TPR) repeat protein